MGAWKRGWILSVTAALLLLGGCSNSSQKGEESTAKSEQSAPAVTKAEAKAPAPSSAAQEAPAVQESGTAVSAKPEGSAASKTDLAPVTAASREEVSKKVDAIVSSVTQEKATAESVKEKMAQEATQAIAVASLYTKCAGCHGPKGDKHALGKSNIIAGQSKEELVKKLEGYQNGTYGGAMKGLMAGQVKGLTHEQIEALAEYISKL